MENQPEDTPSNGEIMDSESEESVNNGEITHSQPEETSHAGPAPNGQALPNGPLAHNDPDGNATLMGLGGLDASAFAPAPPPPGLRRTVHLWGPNNVYDPARIAEGMAEYTRQLETYQAPTEQDIERSGAVIVDIKEEDLGDEADDEDEEEEQGVVEVRPRQERVTVETIIVHGQARKKFKFSPDALNAWFGGQDPYAEKKQQQEYDDKMKAGGPHKVDIISALCANIELAVELGKHLRPKDVISLYSASRAFHNAVRGHLLSSVRTWISYNAPEAGKIFNYRYYKKHLTEDPMGRTYGEMSQGLPERMQPPSDKMDEVRTIPGLKYLQLVIGRDRFCHDIIAILARCGQRLPPTMHSTLLRLWLFMDVATTSHRQAMMHSTYWWRDIDLYNAQFFFIKLMMHFNDPIYGPCSIDLLSLMMGQQGLYPLWQLLSGKRFTTLREILCLKAYYDLELPMERWNNFNRSFYGCPYEDMGTRHCEGWGIGHRHLIRADELVPQEAMQRGLALERHLRNMALWGYFSWETGENLIPTEEEIYIEDEQDVIETMDTTYHWKRKHALKKRWRTLTEEERQEIIAEEKDEHLRAMAFINDDLDSDGFELGGSSIPDSEIERCLDFYDKELAIDNEGDDAPSETESDRTVSDNLSDFRPRYRIEGDTLVLNDNSLGPLPRRDRPGSLPNTGAPISEIADIPAEGIPPPDAPIDETANIPAEDIPPPKIPVEDIIPPAPYYDFQYTPPSLIIPSKRYDLEAELKRGYCFGDPPEGKVPDLNDAAGWGAFIDEILMQVPIEIDEDEKLKSQAWQVYQDECVDWGSSAQRAEAMTDLNWRVEMDLHPLLLPEAEEE